MVLVTACGSAGTPVPVSEAVGRPPPDVGCAMWAAGDPLRGTLTFEEVDGANAVQTWVVADEGTRHYVAWPAGFTARRNDNDELVLVDDQGTPLFNEGDVIELPQVDVRTHAGTTEDPFVASGFFANQCWVPPPDQYAGS